MDRDLLKEVSELFILKVSYGFGQVSVVYDRCVQVIVICTSPVAIRFFLLDPSKQPTPRYYFCV
jgi:hypothetical protein